MIAPKWMAAVIGAAMLFATGPDAQAQERVLEPLDEWNWGKTDEYCGLVRNFGDADSPVRMVIYSYGPTGSYRIMISGDDLPRNDEAAEQGSAAFGDVEDMQNIHMIVGKRGDGGEINFVVHRASGLHFVYAWSGESDTRGSIPLDPDATRVSFDTPEMEPVTLMLGSLESPLADLRACEQELMAGWQVDVVTPEAVATPATIDNISVVAQAIRRPPAMLVNRASQLMQLRLVIDAEGNATDCVLQSPNWRDRDVRGVCTAFTGPGEYTAARNAAGEAVPSLLRASYLMLIYD
ncbi:hypothetical protein [Aurantiacibacter hainanensis]|uniref:hypothetical protein n=1 Tax=Aurantiacibacter hainanensis TaxID=3076114 RepID=UPI0030C74D06